MKKRRIILFSVFGPIFLAVLTYVGLRVYNYFTLQTVMNKILDECPNKSVRIATQYEQYFRTGTLIFDVRQAGGPDAAGTGIDLFFELASRMQDSDFDTVKLCFKGRPLLIVDGPSFKFLGAEFGREDMNKLLADLARSAKLPNGKPLHSIDRRVLARLVQMTGGRIKPQDN